MKKIILAQMFLFFILVVNGQEPTENNRNLTLKLYASSFAGDIYGESMGVGIGAEKMIKSSLSFSQECSYIFHIEDNSLFSTDLENINGIKLTSELRKYFKKTEIPESGFFITTEFKNILTNSTQEAWNNEIKRYRGVLTLNLGLLFYWDKNKKSKITLEFLGGGGVEYINANSSVDVEALGIVSDYNSTKGFYPCLNFDIRLGYVLK